MFTLAKARLSFSSRASAVYHPGNRNYVQRVSRVLQPRLPTLHPHRPKQADHVDISKEKEVYLEYEQSTYPVRYVDVRQQWIPFPPDAKGFFYYRRLAQSSALAGGIRFRKYMPDELTGTIIEADLQLPNGLPWTIPLRHLALLEEYSTLISDLVSNQMVDQETVKKSKRLFQLIHNSSWDSTFLYGLSQTIAVRRDAKLWEWNIVLDDEVVKVHMWAPSILVGFQQKLLEDMNRGYAHLRILRDPTINQFYGQVFRVQSRFGGILLDVLADRQELVDLNREPVKPLDQLLALESRMPSRF
ncbi:hypothetical protein D9758_004774 [Tetrapyrgos nigripes]|uniref:Uncharacterized protein n=1 Tax=Tetrapyrgos nigripes TaxID=182062 RepID=A0A8H5G608_9AGAR|nr:hypothetical protein D9758_004774 [Tetrapyrgos nigripes]